MEQDFILHMACFCLVKFKNFKSTVETFEQAKEGSNGISVVNGERLYYIKLDDKIIFMSEKDIKQELGKIFNTNETKNRTYSKVQEEYIKLLGFIFIQHVAQ